MYDPAVPKYIVPASVLLLLAACAPSFTQVVAPTDSAASSASSSAPSVDSGSGDGMEVTVEPFAEPDQPVVSTGTVAPVAESRDAAALIVGDENAPLSITVYLNPLSPYARDFQRLRMPELIERFVRTGALAVRIATLPIDKYDGEADAVRTTLCAADQGKGYAAHERLYRAGAATLDAKTLADIGVDAKSFDACVASMTGDVLAPLATEAAAGGVTLVPTYIIRGKAYVGLPTQADLVGAINEAL